ncbi:MAG: hypothetical protein HY598_03065 [Candidatus Omnitrophica bacterium]|nr:hypothetical protein [Candidatus Omnitrophota bacterium]
MSDGQEAVQGETKEQKFQRLATKRTQAALQKIRLLSNLAGSSYAYTPEQAAKIIGSLRAAVDAVEARLNRVRGSQRADTSFSL